ncbi:MULTISPECIES: hypothetical protein [unclassified Synechocystis]|uniref:hypothetical protein n=1 Tax=unclassified Synechocystis TaxID=2640012 RepID=UPI0004D162DD|nr:MULTISPECIES: hypothetical protein [unclassified Synechocystis]AIE73017.1 hypothetical protein D082_04880 [Synechocystis sp. PCC 6714]MCT0253537.1 hypothetical protein [Synechocystis sp. CS-94]
MTCCIGKARIYYKEPIGFKFKYSGSANGEVTAQEPLIHNCNLVFPEEDEEGLPNVIYNYVYTASWKTTDNYWLHWYGDSRPESGTYNGTKSNVIGPVSLISVTNETQTQYGVRKTQVMRLYSNGNFHSEIGLPFVSHIDQNYSVSVQGSLVPVNGDPPKEFPKPTYTFKVIGEETGTIYREISGLEECPEVNNLGCVMGEEKYVDTYMGGINGKLLRFIPGFAKIPILTEYKECIKTKKTNNLLGNPVLNVLKYLEADIVDIGWKDIGFESGILSIPIIEGCPDPPVRVVCCPDGDCDPKERCPPDTDCSLDCGDFVCCYKNGKVIKTVRK